MARRQPKTPKGDIVAAEPAPVQAGPLALAETLDLAAAVPLARLLLERRGAPLTVDLSQVGHLGAQCGQILVSAARTWEADGHALALANPSPAFVEGLRLLGLASALSCKDLAP